MKLPVKPKDSWQVIDANGVHVCFAHTMADRDFIVQAINSHEKYKTAYAKAYEGLCTNNLDACDKAIELLDEFKEAEKK